MRQVTRKVAWAVALLLCSGAHADIYKCVDETGHVTYSNVTQKGCQKLELEPLSTVPSAPPKPAAAAKPAQSGSPAGFPKVDSDVQRKRDADRRKILEDELVAEERQLEEAKKALAEQEAVRLGDERNYQKFLDRVQPFRDKVALHQRNVEALRRELANAR